MKSFILSFAWTFTEDENGVEYGRKLNNAFKIYGGIATVYRQSIDFTVNPKYNAK